jgi:hypothetical protein
MGRTLGPFTDVSTARVDGAYEIYEGEDDEGRDIEILTLGATSSKDPSRRALLSDTVAWAHATRGPADAPILSADLSSEQPYVVTLRQTGFRGVERMLERMLAMGPPSGPLPPVTGPLTGQIPAVGYHTNPHGIPAVTSAPPSGSPVAPASPMTSYVTRAKGSRPPWLVPMIVVLSLLIVSSGGFLIFSGMSEGSDTAGHNDTAGDEGEDDRGDANEPGSTGPGEPSSTEEPQWHDEQSTVVGDEKFADGEGDSITERGWPFAFKVLDDMSCDINGISGASCVSQDRGDKQIMLDISLHGCDESCSTLQRGELYDAWWFDQVDTQPVVLNDETSYAVIGDGGLNFCYLSHIFTPSYNAGDYPEFLQVTVEVSGPQSERAGMEKMINGIYGQAR